MKFFFFFSSFYSFKTDVLKCFGSFFSTVEDVCLLDSTEFSQEDSALLQDDKVFEDAGSELPLLLPSETAKAEDEPNTTTDTYVKFSLGDEAEQGSGDGVGVGRGGGDQGENDLTANCHFAPNTKCNSQYATVDSTDSVRFAEHTTVFTVPRLKSRPKKSVSCFLALFLFLSFFPDILYIYIYTLRHGRESCSTAHCSTISKR